MQIQFVIISNYDRLEAMVMDKVFPRDDQEPVSLANFPLSVFRTYY